MQRDIQMVEQTSENLLWFRVQILVAQKQEISHMLAILKPQ